ncbi:MAG: alpha/beta hydrolase [Deltaproteobacteria bacterium]|nr:MAG: alpha/beta hydrolase [Deltaproteobacteria bacterium]
MTEWDLVPHPRGLRLRVCEWGDGPPLLILHGFLEQGAAWSEVARHLPGRRVLAPDHRGHGLSAHVGPGGWYHFHDYVPDAVGLIDHLGGPVDLVGHSMGSTIATLVAATSPERVRNLVLVEGVGPPDMSASAVDRPRRFIQAVLDPPRHTPFASVADAADRMRRFNPRLDAERALALAARITRPADDGDGLVWTWDPLHRGRNPTAFDGKLFEQFLARIEAPTSVIWGADSGFLAAERANRIACLRNLRAEVSIRGAGHLVHHDRPEALAEAIATAVH